MCVCRAKSLSLTARGESVRPQNKNRQANLSFLHHLHAWIQPGGVVCRYCTSDGLDTVHHGHGRRLELRDARGNAARRSHSEELWEDFVAREHRRNRGDEADGVREHHRPVRAGNPVRR